MVIFEAAFAARVPYVDLGGLGTYTVKQIAEQLQIQHHSAVELASRLARRGLLRRERSPADRRAVLLSITKSGEKLIEQIVQYSFQQLEQEAPTLLKTLGKILKDKAKPK